MEPNRRTSSLSLPIKVPRRGRCRASNPKRLHKVQELAKVPITRRSKARVARKNRISPSPRLALARTIRVQCLRTANEHGLDFPHAHAGRLYKPFFLVSRPHSLTGYVWTFWQ